MRFARPSERPRAFLEESFGQIYPTLADLERHRRVKGQGSSRPGASTFAITASGRAS